MQIAIRVLAIAYLAILLFAWACMVFDDGTSWYTMLFMFSPRWAIGLPLFILVPWTLYVRWKLTFAYILHGLVLLFPLFGFQLPDLLGVQFEEGRSLRLISCNLGEGATSVEHLIALIKHHRADVVMLEECPGHVSEPVFQGLGWNMRQKANIAIGSCWQLGELREIATHSQERPNAIVSVACDVVLPGPPRLNAATVATSQGDTVHLIAVHFPTFRPAFEKARSFDSSASSEFVALRDLYRKHVEVTRDDLDVCGIPAVVAGDFNVPVESAFYRDYWGELQNALSVEGFGFCYTKYTRLHGIRIDHVLVDKDWRVKSAFVDAGLGGDHRPVVVELLLKSR